MRNTKGQFQLGHSGGRPKGARNRLAAQVFEDILHHWLRTICPIPNRSLFMQRGRGVANGFLSPQIKAGSLLRARWNAPCTQLGYPDWWKGRRFDKPTIGWGAGTTNETTRDTVQRILVGRPGQPGTAAIPKDAI